VQAQVTAKLWSCFPYAMTQRERQYGGTEDPEEKFSQFCDFLSQVTHIFVFEGIKLPEDVCF
jgi:hypothetical protein